MCTKINNSSSDLYNMAVGFSSKKSGENTRTIDSDEMKQLIDTAAKDGISKDEQEFIDSLKDQTNVEKIAAIGKVTDLEPNSMDFSVKNGKVELKGLNQNSETKQKIYDLLLEKGINPEEITYTFKYLDSINADYSQVDTLVNNQFAKAEKNKDKGWDAQDVFGAVQAYAVINDALKSNVPNSKYLEQIKNDLVSGKVRIDSKTERKDKDMNEAHAKYNFDQDTIYLKDSFNITSDMDKSILLHELVHTTQDVQYQGDTNVDMYRAELEAYKSQGVYLAKKGTKVEPEDVIAYNAKKFGIAYNKVTELKKELDNTSDPIKKQELSKELNKWEKGLEKLEEKLIGIVYDYHPQGRDLLPADGLSVHK